MNNGSYHFHLRPSYFEAQRHEDVKLLARIQSRHALDRMRALMEAVYAVRCNSLPGCQFAVDQTPALLPVTVLVHKVSVLLLEKLTTYDEQVPG